ncbi:unnamed protein product [Ambrosiozyma monospora]|uniref:Unnamed protein product n=1 Tax=Ambrosiozyma monospora TaxID=43982 RepID=A0ACB5SZW5_AMBMO|nr:unnamed protein product [Ambrosiozyma monospora]
MAKIFQEIFASQNAIKDGLRSIRNDMRDMRDDLRVIGNDLHGIRRLTQNTNNRQRNLNFNHNLTLRKIWFPKSDGFKKEDYLRDLSSWEAIQGITKRNKLLGNLQSYGIDPDANNPDMFVMQLKLFTHLGGNPNAVL